MRFRYSRRNNWTREEWILAYDACPKVNQSYGPDAPFVRELADLIGRTPAAVSRAFGNLWAAQTRGKHGLKNYSRLAGEVVEEYRNDPTRLRRDALRLRRDRFPQLVTPRLEVVSRDGGSPLPEDAVHSAARDAGLSSDLYFVTTRAGSVTVDVGILLEGLLIGTTGWLAISNTIQIIQNYLRKRRTQRSSPVLEISNRTWKDVDAGRTKQVEERVIKLYLGDSPSRQLSSDDTTRLVGFLAFLRGTRREKISAASDEVRLGRTVGRPFSRGALQRILTIDLSGASTDVLKQLSDLVKAARSAKFESALRRTRKAAKPPRRSR